jgi:dTDP-4-dehydrorhamnose 3,5-epimerase
MKFSETRLKGAFVIEPERLEDERGWFARTFCAEEFVAHGLDPGVAQCNVSYNRRRGTLRGMHYQAPPHAEARLVRCTAGAVYDVIVDIRPRSATFKQWLGVELSAANQKQLYVPEGFAHGFVTLAEDTEFFYQMSEAYSAEATRGFRWNDPAVGIVWPMQPVVVSARDASLPLLSAAA